MENRIAQIRYSYHDTYLGNAYLELAANNGSTYEFDTNLNSTDVSVEKTDQPPEEPIQTNTIFINVKKILIIVLSLSAAVMFLFILRAFAVNSQNAKRRQNRVKRRQRRRERIRSGFDDFDF